MVSLAQVQKSNSQIKTNLPAGLVGVFTGATSGIGESTLKEFVRETVKPRCYFLGRSQTAGDRIIQECKEINPDAELIFMAADLSLIKTVDNVCRQIKAKEKAINFLLLSAGSVYLDGSKTSEGIHKLFAAAFYGRVRFTQQLLPELRRAEHLSRVVTVARGCSEGELHPEDWQALKIPRTQMRGHVTTMFTLCNDVLAKEAPEVTFIHSYPGLVLTNLFSYLPGLLGYVVRFVMFTVGRLFAVPIPECGQRHVSYLTSAMFLAPKGGKDGVPLVEGTDVAMGTDGVVASGSYTIDKAGKGPSENVIKLLENYRKKGMDQQLWDHMNEVFEQALQSSAD